MSSLQYGAASREDETQDIPNHRFDSAVESFCLSIRLEMINRHERNLNVKSLAEALENFSSEVSEVFCK